MTELSRPAAPAGHPEPIIEIRDVSISFPGIKALDGVSFRMFPGEVHSLMGENGAGKSTLIKALTGVYQIDSGSIVFAGAPVSFRGTAQAQDAGISTVYQEVNLLPNLSVAENIMLGREPRKWGSIDTRAMRAQSRVVLDTLGLDVDPDSILGSHSLAIQQLISIARAIHINARVLILDEPTSSLDADEVAELFRIIRSLRDDGVAILFVSHFLDQVYEIADRLTVLRNGRLVGEHLTPELLRIELVQKMIGKEIATLDDLEQRVRENDQSTPEAVPFLRASGIGRKGSVSAVDITIGEGEVVGFAGLLGSGRTEVARLLGGIDRADAGTLEILGDSIRLRTLVRHCRGVSRTPVRIVEPKASSTSSPCATTSSSRSRPIVAGSGRSRANARMSSRRATSTRCTSARRIQTRSCAISPVATSRRYCSVGGSPSHQSC